MALVWRPCRREDSAASCKHRRRWSDIDSLQDHLDDMDDGRKLRVAETAVLLRCDAASADLADNRAVVCTREARLCRSA